MHLVDALLACDPILGGVRGVGLPDGHGGDGEEAEEEGEHGGRLMRQGDQRHFYIVYLLCTTSNFIRLFVGLWGTLTCAGQNNHVTSWCQNPNDSQEYL